MATNLALDDQLIEKAKKLGRHRSKKEAVTVALEEYIKRYQQTKIVDLFGQLDWDSAYQYKKHRSKGKP